MLEDLDNLKKHFREYFKLQFDIVRLQSAENISRILSRSANAAIISYFLFFILLFGSLSAAFVISARLNSQAFGFLIVAGFYFFLMTVYLLFRKRIIERPIIRGIVRMFFPESDKKN